MLTINGVGFRDGPRIRVRLSVPHAAPAAPGAKERKGKTGAPPPRVFLQSSEPRDVVVGTFVDRETITFVAPNMGDILCDGKVLVEVRASTTLTPTLTLTSLTAGCSSRHALSPSPDRPP